MDEASFNWLSHYRVFKFVLQIFHITEGEHMHFLFNNISLKLTPIDHPLEQVLELCEIQISLPYAALDV